MARTLLVCAVNQGDTAVTLAPGSLILASTELPDGALPADAAAWWVVR